MNSKQNNKSQDQNAEKLKEIPKWTRKYAQNRTLTSFIVIVITMLIAMVVAVQSYLVVIAFMKGNMILASVCTAVLLAILIFLIIFISKYGGKNRGLIDQRIDQWIYGHEGTASMPEPKLTKKNKWLGFVVAAVVFICIQGSYYLSMEGYIAFKYMQPVSALYLVPFLVLLYFEQRPRVGPLVLICPILYTIHAILIIAGIPIFFTGNWGILNIVLPVFGYTFLAYVIAHVYSRYALKKLKGLTHLEGDTANGD
ncbi:MAG TPA: hypothetical protein VMX36_06000 [Sedimentisphaerales bacterium]|nr:hypothetical protein [Sedimentisphaerales bacterium]